MALGPGRRRRDDRGTKGGGHWVKGCEAYSDSVHWLGTGGKLGKRRVVSGEMDGEGSSGAMVGSGWGGEWGVVRQAHQGRRVRWDGLVCWVPAPDRVPRIVSEAAGAGSARG